MYSWAWELDAGQLGPASTVTVEFRADGERTNLVLEHTGLASAESRDQHAHGWNACLDILGRRVFPAAGAHRRRPMVSSNRHKPHNQINNPNKEGFRMANYLLAYTGGGMAETQAEREAAISAWGRVVRQAWPGGRRPR